MRRVPLLALVAGLMVLSGCGSKAPDAKAESKPGEASKTIEIPADSQKIAGIEVAPATTRTIQESITAPGVIASTGKNRALVTPPVAGRIIRLSVQLGDVVRQGQILAVIESSDLAQSWQSVAEAQRSRDAASAELNQASSEAKLAEAKVQTARTNLARQREMAKAGAFNQAPLQQAQSDLNDAQSELLDAQGQLDFHNKQLDRAERLFKEGLVSKADLEAARLDVQFDQNRRSKGKGRVELAKLAFDREKSIAQKGLLNAREIQAAEAELRSSQLELGKANVMVDSARAALSNSERAIRNASATYRTLSGGGGATGGQVAITAPIAGTVTHLDVTRGQAVDRTQVLMGIENLSSLWATASVQEKDIASVVVGERCTITTSSHEGPSFEGTVQIVASHLDPKTRTMPVQCLILHTGSALKPDMFVTVRIGLKRSRSALTVASSAVTKDGDKDVVFVKEGDKFERREVTLGTADGAYTEILSGVKTGEQVAVKGSFVLTSESKKDELRGEE